LLLRSAVGWELFKRFLHVHHTSEDTTLWPVMRQALAGRPDDLALLDAMESEHARLDSLIAQVDAALADAEHGPERLGDLVDALVSALSEHLGHEEREGLRLIDAVMTPEQWQRFGENHRQRVGSGASRYLPWLLEDANPQYAAAILSRIPEHFQRRTTPNGGPPTPAWIAGATPGPDRPQPTPRHYRTVWRYPSLRSARPRPRASLSHPPRRNYDNRPRLSHRGARRDSQSGRTPRTRLGAAGHRLRSATDQPGQHHRQYRLAQYGDRAGHLP